MKRISTQTHVSFSKYLFSLTALLFFTGTSTIFGQSACNNESILFLENFGTGTVAKPNADVVGLTYQDAGPLSNEGVYRVTNNTGQKPEWQMSPDHTTGDENGNMIVLNAGNAGDFYSHQITSTPGFSAGTYNASFYIMNVDTLGICGSGALLPNITVSMEYLSQDGKSWIPFDGSPMQATPVPQTPSLSPTWVSMGFSYTLPAVNFPVTSLRLVLESMGGSGCGDDFALDDIKVSQCAEGGPLPITLLNFGAHQKGSGVLIEWSTSMEINSSSFNVEKSSDGSTGWNTVATVNAAGNSSSVKDYNAFDAKPSTGTNFYRIKQIDKDGVAKYSKTVRLNINTAAASTSVLANPFHKLLTIDLLSSTNQSVSARIMDITGKQVVSEKWNISSGSTRKEISSAGNLQAGIYILTIADSNGQIIYNNKIIKQ